MGIEITEALSIQSLYIWNFVNIMMTSTTPSCSGPIPVQKSRCKSVLGVPRCPKWIFIILIVLVEKNTLNWYITCHGYINIHHSPFICPIKINRKFWKDHEGSEIKFTYFHRNCWKKIAQNDRSHAMDISKITKVVMKNCNKKNRKNNPFNRKKKVFNF